jgi:hypothetical protein
MSTARVEHKSVSPNNVLTGGYLPSELGNSYLTISEFTDVDTKLND